MAHIFLSQKGILPLFFNVDSPVGAPPAQNNMEDVLLVQFAFSVLANSQSEGLDREALAAAKEVKVTGSIDDKTITAIRLFQEFLRSVAGPGQVVDGRVSTARGISYGPATAVWTIWYLNRIMANSSPRTWPRIDQIPSCPARLRQMVGRILAGQDYL